MLILIYLNFDMTVKPLLLYGAEIWGFELLAILENVQNHFCKRFRCLLIHVIYFPGGNMGDIHFILIITADV